MPFKNAVVACYLSHAMSQVADGHSGGAVDTLGVVSWNVHWQCGSHPPCRATAVQRLVEIVQEQNARIAVAVELELNSSTPLSLPSNGLPGWSQVDGSCPGGNSNSAGDALAIAFAPELSVMAEGGGCLNDPADSARAFAVAHVKPPRPVGHCQTVCVVAVHTPHKNISHGSETVARVCGKVAQECAIAAGDWNAMINKSDWPSTRPPLMNPINASQFWMQLVPNSASLTVQTPEGVSCCYPQEKYYGFDDHLLTNVRGVQATGAVVYPYQLKTGGIYGNDTEEHKPIAVNLTWPAAAARVEIV